MKKTIIRKLIRNLGFLRKLIRNLGFLLLVFLFLLPISYAIIFSGSVQVGTSINTSEGEFMVYATEDYSMVIIKFSENTVIVAEDKCEKKKNFKFCYEGTADETENRTVHGTDTTMLDLKISFTGPKISITRILKSPLTEIGDEAIIEVKLTNVGKATAKNIYYSDEFLSGIEILEVANATKTANSATWTGSILAGQKKSFSYKLKAVDFIDEEFKAKVKYKNDAGEEYVVFSNVIKIHVEGEEDSFDLHYSLGEVKLGEKTNLEIDIENKLDEELNVNLSVSIPDNVSISSESFSEEDGKLKWTGIINASETKSLSLDLTAEADAVITVIANSGVEEEIKEITVDVNESVSQETEERVGFFRKMINFFKKIFKR